MTPFPLPVMFTAWGFKDGAGHAGEVIRQAKLMGARTVAVQLSEDTVDNTADGGSTLDRYDVQAMQDAGFHVVGWGPVDALTKSESLDLGVDGWLPQVETPDQRDGLIALCKLRTIGLPKALVTTYGGLDTHDDYEALKAAWGGDPFTLVECYKADGYPHNDITRMLAQGTVYGFSGVQLYALVGTYRGETPADYPGLSSVNYGGLYVAEQTTDAQLQAFAALANAPAPQPAPEPTPAPSTTADPATLNKQIAALAHKWLDPFLPDQKPLTRLRCIARIAETSDSEWVAVRQAVVDALNGNTLLQEQLAETQKQLDAARTLNTTYTSAIDELKAKIAAAKTALK